MTCLAVQPLEGRRRRRRRPRSSLLQSIHPPERPPLWPHLPSGVNKCAPRRHRALAGIRRLLGPMLVCQRDEGRGPVGAAPRSSQAAL